MRDGFGIDLLVMRTMFFRGGLVGVSIRRIGGMRGEWGSMGASGEVMR